MTKKQCIALAQTVRHELFPLIEPIMIDRLSEKSIKDVENVICQVLAHFCAEQNPQFDSARWLDCVWRRPISETQAQGELPIVRCPACMRHLWPLVLSNDR